MRLCGGWSVENDSLIRPDGRACAPDEAITAREIYDCLRIPQHVTLFHNHDGLVPAAHVVRQALSRSSRGRPPKPERLQRVLFMVTARQREWITSMSPAEFREILERLIAESGATS